MNSGTYITYPTVHSNKDIAEAVALIEGATHMIKRDLLITAMMVLILGLSDSTILQDELRFRTALENLSHQICFIISGTSIIDPKDMN